MNAVKTTRAAAGRIVSGRVQQLAPPRTVALIAFSTDTVTTRRTDNAARATTVTVVLGNILAQTGYIHGGINE